MKSFRLMLVLALLLVACTTPAGSSPLASSSPRPSPAGSLTISPTIVPTQLPVTTAGEQPSVTGTVTAGPVCPVERNPPDPSCAPRPVDGAVIVATNANGQEAGRATTAADGTYRLTVAGTGTFTVTGLPFAGLMNVPAPVTVSLTHSSDTEQVDLQYDTGIR